MFTEIKNTLRKNRGSIIGWGIGLFAYAFFLADFYSEAIAMADEFEAMLASYPEEMLAFFPNIMDAVSPVGYIDTYFFSIMGVLAGVFAISICTNLFIGEEEKGILDLILAHPIHRNQLFLGRLIGFLLAAVVVLAFSWIGWIIPAQGAGIDLTAVEFLRPFVSVFAVGVLFGALATLLSMLLPSVRLASATSIGLVVINYLIGGMANLNPDRMQVYKFTPFYYYQGGQAASGINWTWIAGLSTAFVVIGLIAWWQFSIRNIRVGGEAGWQIPFLKARKSL